MRTEYKLTIGNKKERVSKIKIKLENDASDYSVRIR